MNENFKAIVISIHYGYFNIKGESFELHQILK